MTHSHGAAIMEKPAAALTWRESMHLAAPCGRNFGLPTHSLLMLSFAQKRVTAGSEGPCKESTHFQ
jgi:hypothetical protein